MIHDADAAGLFVAERNQLFAEQHQLDRLAAGLQFARFGSGDPVLAHQIAHHGTGANSCQFVALDR
jgi:hypothetical protein